MICNLCPRQCGAVRTAERGDGLCGMPEGAHGGPGRPPHVGGASHLRHPGVGYSRCFLSDAP